MPDIKKNKSVLLDKSLLRPIEYQNLKRVGSKGDGGYVVPIDQIPNCETLLSLGLSDNWEFDKEFLAINPKVNVIGVDHTIGTWWFVRRIVLYSWEIILHSTFLNRAKRGKYVTKLRNSMEYFTFFGEPNTHLKRKVSANNGGINITLDRIFGSNPKASACHDVFLKMDIEGGEYDVTEDIVRHQNRIRCIAAEFHELDKRTDDFNKCIQRLSQNFLVIHVHGNNGAAYDRINDFPTVVEITFINKALLDHELLYSSHEYPREGLDFPNNSAVSDYGLKFFE